MAVLLALGAVLYFDRSNDEAEIADAVRVYYDTKGEWAGTYTIREISRIEIDFLTKDDARANVEYIYAGRSEGIDMRWFLVSRQPSGEWVGQGMGPHMSARF
ncbi:MAG: hypothetical protein AAGI88_25465 [Pseudomonadota bacterium]